MRTISKWLLTSLALSTTIAAWSQVQFDTPTGNVRFDPTGFARSFCIGNAYDFSSALVVRGDLLPQLTTPGETFRTVSPGGTANIWRMLRGGTEIGRFLSNLNLAPTAHFFMNSPNGSMFFQTTSLNRMRINRTLTGITTNGYILNDHSGNVGIGGFAAAPVDAPFSMLHIDRAGNQVTGWRPWMKAGTFITDHSDQMYVGTKLTTADRIDAVIAPLPAKNAPMYIRYTPKVLRSPGQLGRVRCQEGAVG